MEYASMPSAAVCEALQAISGLASRDAAVMHVDDMILVIECVATALVIVSRDHTPLQALADAISSIVAVVREASDVRIAALVLLATDVFSELLHIAGPTPGWVVNAAESATRILEDIRAILDSPPRHDVSAQESQKLAFRELVPRLSQLKAQLRHCAGDRVATSSSLPRVLCNIVAPPSAPNSLVPRLRFSHAGYLATVDVSGAQIGRGAGGTVYHGSMLVGAQDKSERVAVKVFVLAELARDPSAGMTQVPPALRRELKAWCQLCHERILPLYGTSAFGTGRVALVSPYMPDGDLGQYLKAHRFADTGRLLVQAAEGLRYLHMDAGIVHGDLKCENILVSPTGSALLADFGLSTTAAAADITTVTTLRMLHTLRHSARELIVDEAFTPGHPARRRSKTMMSDVYAFGMVIYQAYSRQHPWAGASDVQVVMAIHEGRHPPRPSAELLGDALWELCVKCWSSDAAARPAIAEIIDYMGRL